MEARDLLLNRLKQRNQKSHRYTQFFAYYSELIDRVAVLTAHKERMRKDGGSTDSDSSPTSSKELEELRAELNQLYKTKALNDQQLIDTNNRLQQSEKHCAKLQDGVDSSNESASQLAAQVMGLEDKVTDLEKTNQHLRDEYLALDAVYKALNEKFIRTMDENEQLLARWKEAKQKEVELVNKQNDEDIKKKQLRLQTDLNAAAKQPVPIFDANKFELVEPAGASGYFGGDCVPTRCKVRWEAHESEVNAVRWSPSGRQFVTGGADRKLKVWEVNEGKQRHVATLTGSNQAIMSLDMDSEEKQVLAGSNDFAVRIWTIADQRCRDSLTGHSGQVFTAKFHQSATQVASGSKDKTIKLWDLRSRRCVRTLFAGSTCHDLVTSEGSASSVISGHYDKKLRFWDSRADSKAQEMLLEGKITSLDLSSDLYYLLCATREDSLNLIDLRTTKILHTYCGESFRVGCDYSRAVLSPNMEYCACGSADGHLFIWNVKNTKIEKILTRGHENSIIATSWHPHGHCILSVDRHRTVCLWSEF